MYNLLNCMVLQAANPGENIGEKHLDPNPTAVQPVPADSFGNLNTPTPERCYALSHGNIRINISRPNGFSRHALNGHEPEDATALQNLQVFLDDSAGKEIGEIFIGPLKDELAAALIEKFLIFGEGEDDTVTGLERVLLTSAELRESLEELSDNEISIRSTMGDSIEAVVAYYSDRVYPLAIDGEPSPAANPEPIACCATKENVLTFDANGRVKSSQEFTAHDKIPDGGMVWIDVEAPNQDTIKKLKDRFGFSTVDLADCLELNQKTKLRDHENYLFIVTHAFSGNGGELTHFETKEVHAFLGKDFLITIHAEPIKPLSDIFENVSTLQICADDRKPDYLYFLVSESLMGVNAPFSEKMRKGIEDIYRKAEHGKMGEGDLPISPANLTLMLMSMRGLIADQAGTFSTLSDREHALIGPGRRRLFRNLATETRQIVEDVQDDLSLVDRAVRITHAQATNRLGKINTKLAVLGAVVLPWMATSSFFGQNFTGIPFHSNMLLSLQVGVSLALSGILLWVGKKQGLI